MKASRPTRWRGGVLLAAALVLACERRPPSPEAAYMAFAHAVADRDARAAFALLSSDTRAWLDARAREVANAAPGVVPASGEKLLLGDAALAARPLTSVVVVRQSSDSALLRVTEEGGAEKEVELVREKGWRVRIPREAPR